MCTFLGFECGYIAIWHAAAVAASEAMAGHGQLVGHTMGIPFDEAPTGAEYRRKLQVVLTALNPEVARIARADLRLGSSGDYGYGWIPHNASFGFLDLAPSILHSNRFWDYIS
jgi:hypothetical protein